MDISRGSYCRFKLRNGDIVPVNGLGDSHPAEFGIEADKGVWVEAGHEQWKPLVKKP